MFTVFTEVSPLTTFTRENSSSGKTFTSIKEDCINKIIHFCKKLPDTATSEIPILKDTFKLEELKLEETKDYMCRTDFYTNMIGSNKTLDNVFFSTENIEKLIQRFYYYMTVSDHYNFLVEPHMMNEGGRRLWKFRSRRRTGGLRNTLNMRIQKQDKWSRRIRRSAHIMSQRSGY